MNSLLFAPHDAAVQFLLHEGENPRLYPTRRVLLNMAQQRADNRRPTHRTPDVVGGISAESPQGCCGDWCQCQGMDKQGLL